MKISKWLILVVMTLGLALTVVPAQAALLAPGAGPVGPDVFAGGYGAIVADTGLVAYSGVVGDFHGTFRSIVVIDGVTGNLDFLYEIMNDTTSIATINRTTATSFAGFTTDVGCDPTIDLIVGFLHITPTSVDRSAGIGSTVGWNFPLGSANGALTPGSDSEVLVIKTNAQTWTVGAFNAIDGDVSHINAFAPAVIPEPISLILLGSGLAGAGIYRRLRKPKG